ncbi:unnamed protein product [Brassica oleracea]
MLCTRVITQNRHMLFNQRVANNTSGSGYVRSVGSAYGSRGSLAGESGG